MKVVAVVSAARDARAASKGANTAAVEVVAMPVLPERVVVISAAEVATTETEGVTATVEEETATENIAAEVVITVATAVAMVTDTVTDTDTVEAVAVDTTLVGSTTTRVVAAMVAGDSNKAPQLAITNLP